MKRAEKKYKRRYKGLLLFLRGWFYPFHDSSLPLPIYPLVLSLPHFLPNSSLATYSHFQPQAGVIIFTILNTNRYLVTYNHSQPQAVLSFFLTISIHKNLQYFDYSQCKHIIGRRKPFPVTIPILLVFSSLNPCIWQLNCLSEPWFDNEIYQSPLLS